MCKRLERNDRQLNIRSTKGFREFGPRSSGEMCASHSLKSHDGEIELSESSFQTSETTTLQNTANLSLNLDHIHDRGLNAINGRMPLPSDDNGATNGLQGNNPRR